MDLPSLLPCLLITLPFILGIWLQRKRTKVKQNLPPGPWPLPLIGNILKLGDQPHKSLTNLAKLYGPIMTLKLGQVTTIVISSSTIAKEVLQTHDLAFSTRPIPNELHAHDIFRYSMVVMPVSDRWRSLRKIFNSVILAKHRVSNNYLRLKKVEELLAYCRKCCEKGEAFSVGQAAFTTSLNILSNTIFSVDLVDPSVGSSGQFKDLVRNILMESTKPNLVDYLPILAKIDPQGIRCRMIVYFGKLIEVFSTLIEERLESRKSHKINVENDVLDALLINISQGNTKEIDRTQMEHLFTDIFIAGTDTTSSTMEWAMAEVLHDSSILKKAKTELEQTIGKGKRVDESDINRLPYLQAILKETMRMHPPAPFLIPRKVDTDVEINGYTIPKGAQVFVNAWAIGRDPGLWESPTKFMPERFLGSDIDFKGRNFELIPFGSGRRICPGMALAVLIVPMVVGSLLNSFDWKLEDGIAPEELDMDEKFGITLQRANPLRVVPLLS